MQYDMMEHAVTAIPTLAIVGTVASLFAMAVTRAVSIAGTNLISETIALFRS